MTLVNDTFVGLGLALVCDYNGKVSEVIWDDFGLRDKLHDMTHLVHIFDIASIKKGLAFFLALKEHNVAFDWEIDTYIDGHPAAMNFSGAATGGKLLILASVASQDGNKIYEGLSRVINAQVNDLRTISKRNSMTPATADTNAMLPDQVKVEMITDMLALNNRLVNAERQLARKHAELERMSKTLSQDLQLAHRIMQFSGEAIMVANPERRVVEVNSAYTAITGFCKDEVTGQELRLVEMEYDNENLSSEIWNILSNQGLWQGECMGRRKNGDLFPKWLSIAVVPDRRGNIGHYVVNFSDISRLKYAEEQWQKLAFYDSLTNLPNRTLFRDRLQQAMKQATRDDDSLILLFIDLDDFKVVNDSMGHDCGDALLCESARRLEACTRETDTIYRLGGDEFTVIVRGCHSDLDAIQLCDKIITLLSTPFVIQGQTFHISASIGIARYPHDGDTPDLLTKNADVAMYSAKANGRNTSCFFSKSLGEKVSNYLNLRSQIAEGIQHKEFSVFLQPEIELSTGKVVSFEALLRWQHPTRGLVCPGEFIPVAEDSGLIVELGEFVLHEALGMVGKLRDCGQAAVKLAVNVSGRHLALPHFADTIINGLHSYQLPGDALIVEVTESMILHNLDKSVQQLRKLREHGIDSAIDDFGTGYSSLNHLRRLPVAFLKIDKSFIADVDLATESQSIVRAIVAMAASLGMKTIAEGIERPSQQATLVELGCELGQGYWYAKPQPFAKVLDVDYFNSIVRTS